MVKNPPASAEDIRDEGSTPGPGRSPRGGHGNPANQYSCLQNVTDRGAWWAIVHRGLKELDTTHVCTRLSWFTELY